MKKLKPALMFFTLIFIISFSLSCENGTEPEAYYSQYYGNWEWIKTSGGFGGGTRYPEEGTSVIITFDNSYRFRLYRNNTLRVYANYHITPDSIYGDKIDYSNIETYDYLFYSDLGYAQFVDGNLRIWDGMIDGFYYHYSKIE